jgi:hypothetical protein
VFRSSDTIRSGQQAALGADVIAFTAAVLEVAGLR